MIASVFQIGGGADRRSPCVGADRICSRPMRMQANRLCSIGIGPRGRPTSWAGPLDSIPRRPYNKQYEQVAARPERAGSGRAAANGIGERAMDVAVIERARQGDEDAFAAIYEF